jgi:intracellular multiplication protein IcmL
MSHSLGMLVTLVLILAQLSLLGWNYIAYASRNLGAYYGITPSNQSIILHPLLRPTISIPALLSWATVAATATFSIDFVNYSRTLNELKQYFTTEGYDSFLLALESASVLETIQSKKLVLSAVPIGPAIIVEESDHYGMHAWRIQVPLIVSYLSASSEEKGYKLVTVLVSQVPTSSAVTGLGITQYQSIDLSQDVLSELT